MEHKKIVITGGSRGIGRALALKFAKQGAHVAILAKTIDPHPKLEGTLMTVAEEIIELGGHAYPMQLDVREEDNIKVVIDRVAEMMDGIDILINNASAISLTNTEMTSSKRFDLMFDINVRGTFLVTQACLPYLKNGNNPHILTLSPPLNMDPKWFGMHVAYTISKYNMSMLTMGWAEEFKEYGIAANALWPKTLIATAAIENLPGGEHLVKMARKADIIADAAQIILKKDCKQFSGNFVIDEELLLSEGFSDLNKYNAVECVDPMKDLFLD